MWSLFRILNKHNFFAGYFILAGFFAFSGFFAPSLSPRLPVAQATSQGLSADFCSNYGLLLKLKNSPKVYQLNCPIKESFSEYIKTNLKNASVEYIEPNYSYHMVLEPNDPYYTQQIYLGSIRANLAWNHTIGSRAIVIAIIDSGVDIDHPDLKNNIWHNLKEIPHNGLDDDHNGYVDDYSGWDFVTDSADPRPKLGKSYSYLGVNHGTIVAGVAAAQGNNGQGITGISWHSKIMPLRVLDGTGTGNTLNVARAIDYAVANGADIINLSFVGSGRSHTLQQAIQRANQAGVLVVAAAGNEVDHGLDMTYTPRYPVCQDGGFGHNWVIGVGSVDRHNYLASFSNYGKCVDLVTPGVGIFSTLYKIPQQSKFSRLYGGYWSGTSVSAPQVSAAAALVKSLRQDLTLEELKKIILSSTDDIDYLNLRYHGKLGTGKLNLYKAVLNAQRLVSRVEHGHDVLVTGAGPGGGPHVRIFENGRLRGQFFAFDKMQRNGVRVATHDFNHDGRAEIIAYANRGADPQIKIYDLHGNLKVSFYAFDKSMHHGLSLTAADLDNNGQDEIIVAPGAGEPALIKIFNLRGQLIKSFYPFNRFYTGGINLAAADVNRDGFNEIIVATDGQTTPLIKIFNYQTKLISQFMPDEVGGFFGVNIAAGDIDGDGRAEIITGAGYGRSPQVKVFDWFGHLKLSFPAYNPYFHGGVHVAAGDLNSDGRAEIITGAGRGGGPHVRIFNYQGKVIGQFFAYQQNFHGGVYVSSGK
jgi:subtilisin family serine protease